MTTNVRPSWQPRPRPCVGAIVWRPAIAHAAEGLQPLDVEVRLVQENVCGTIQAGYVVYAFSGDVLNRLGVKPTLATEEDPAWRAAVAWKQNSAKGGFLGVKVYLPEPAPEHWTHVEIVKATRVSDQTQEFTVYYGEWRFDPDAFITRYRDAEFSERELDSHARATLKNVKGLREALEALYNADVVKKNLGLKTKILDNGGTVETQQQEVPQPSQPV